MASLDCPIPVCGDPTLRWHRYRRHMHNVVEKLPFPTPPEHALIFKNPHKDCSLGGATA